MNYLVYTIRQSDHPSLNTALEGEHIAWFGELGDTCKLASPFLSEDGTKITGGILVLDAGSFEEAEKIAAHDPFVKAGIYETHRVHPMGGGI